MIRTLDPFHRIRATVSGVFALVVLTLVLTSAIIGPRHARVSAAAIGAAALPTGAVVASKHRPARVPAARGARPGS